MAQTPRGQSIVEAILERADVRVNGTRPWDVRVHNSRFFHRVLARGSLALGESYMDGWQDCAALDELTARLLRAELDRAVCTWRTALSVTVAVLVNQQSQSHAFEIGERHYDILICRKVGLQRGQRILDIGCGWCGLVKFAAERQGVSAVGVTVSREQAAFARDRCAGLPVEIRLQDYRRLDERFDHVISVGMFEHVGSKNYRTFMDIVRRCLKNDGLFLLHTIGGNRSVRGTDPWIGTYILPNSMLPSIAQIGRAIEGRFVMEDWHNFGLDYDRTLMAWHVNFEAAWPTLQSKYGDRFYRMWRYYLLTCAGSFRSRHNQLWQIVLSPHGVSGGYRPVR